MKLSIINRQDFIFIVKEEHIICLEVDFLKLIKHNMTKKCENECVVTYMYITVRFFTYTLVAKD